MLPPRDLPRALKIRVFSKTGCSDAISLGEVAVFLLAGGLEMVFLAWLLFSCKIISPRGSGMCASQKSCPAATSCPINIVTQPLRPGNTSVLRCASTPVTYPFHFSCSAVGVFQQTKTEGGFAAPTPAGRSTHERMICNEYSAR